MRALKSGTLINMAKCGQKYSVNRRKIKYDADRLNKVEQDVSEIKDMLKQLIER